MVMLLKTNYEHISAYGVIPMIYSNDIRACVPARFNGLDLHLLAAQSAFDVLVNNEAPPADGVGSLVATASTVVVKSGRARVHRLYRVNAFVVSL